MRGLCQIGAAGVANEVLLTTQKQMLRDGRFGGEYIEAASPDSEKFREYCFHHGRSQMGQGQTLCRVFAQAGNVEMTVQGHTFPEYIGMFPCLQICRVSTGADASDVLAAFVQREEVTADAGATPSAVNPGDWYS